MGRKPTVGGAAAQSQFAREITAYLSHVRDASGMSVRQVARLTEGERGLTWWADVFNGSKILTTNDVHYVATELMGISPYEFVANARRLSLNQPFAVQAFNVGGITDDDYQQEASEAQSVPTRKVAKRGTPKARKAFEGDDEGATDDGGESGP